MKNSKVIQRTPLPVLPTMPSEWGERGNKDADQPAYLPPRSLAFDVACRR